MSKDNNELKDLCNFFDKYGDEGGQYIDEEYIGYNGKLPTIYIRGIWNRSFRDNFNQQFGTYIGKRRVIKKT